MTKQQPIFNKVRSYALFEYYEFDATIYKERIEQGQFGGHPSRKISKIIPFTIISKLQNKYVSIQLYEPMLLNWGRGLTDPSLYYQLNYDHTRAVYCSDDNSKLTKQIIMKTCEVCPSAHNEKWSSDIECTICLEIKQCLINIPCMHVSYCDACYNKLNNKVCLTCLNKIGFVVETVNVEEVFIQAD